MCCAFVAAGEASGPLDEIHFWRERSVDLGGIRTQLDNPAVAAIVAVLEQAKSSYLGPFLDLRNLINRCVRGEVSLTPWPVHASPRPRCKACGLWDHCWQLPSLRA